MPHGKIVYASAARDTPGGANGNRAIWIINSDGSHLRQLTTEDGVDTNPAVTPDGRQIVFASHRDGAWGCWRGDIDGGNLSLLANTGAKLQPTVSSTDGRWVFFQRLGSDWQPRASRVPLEGGEVVELTQVNSALDRQPDFGKNPSRSAAD